MSDPIKTTQTETFDHELRAAGFSAGSRAFPRDENARRLLCAFVGIERDAMPAAWGYHANDATRRAWQRVADEAAVIFGATNG